MKLLAVEDPLGGAGVAQICHRIRGRDRQPYVEIMTVKRYNGRPMRVSHILPTYDMSRIRIPNPKFYCADYDEQVHKACMESPEGREVINTMKNERTLAIVNQYTQYFDHDVKIDPDKEAQGHPSKLKNFVRELLDSPLADSRVQNQLRSVKIRKEESWLRFKKEGLVDKIKSLKK